MYCKKRSGPKYSLLLLYYLIKGSKISIAPSLLSLSLQFREGACFPLKEVSLLYIIILGLYQFIEMFAYFTTL